MTPFKAVLYQTGQLNIFAYLDRRWQLYQTHVATCETPRQAGDILTICGWTLTGQWHTIAGTHIVRIARRPCAD